MQSCQLNVVAHGLDVGLLHMTTQYADESGRERTRRSQKLELKQLLKSSLKLEKIAEKILCDRPRRCLGADPKGCNPDPEQPSAKCDEWRYMFESSGDSLSYLYTTPFPTAIPLV